MRGYITWSDGAHRALFSAIMAFYPPHLLDDNIVPSSLMRYLEFPVEMFPYGLDNQATPPFFGHGSNTNALNVPDQVESTWKFTRALN